MHTIPNSLLYIYKKYSYKQGDILLSETSERDDQKEGIIGEETKIIIQSIIIIPLFYKNTSEEVFL